MAKICVMGLGYIGCPTALLLATHGHEVVGFDVNIKIIKTLQSGKIHIIEPGLAELFASAKGYFSATSQVPEADVFLIAVPTPFEKDTRVSDLTYVKSAAEMIVPVLKKGNLVILESTVPPCASEKVVIPILEKSGLKAGEFFYAHCPERAIPGKTLYEMEHNDRIVGGIDKLSSQITRDIYASYVKGTIHLTDTKTAEFVKLTENTFRDVNIAFANELAKIAEDYGVNVWDVIDLANKHPRVNILSPGPGVGGHCIAVDPWFLTENTSNANLILQSRLINDYMPNYVMMHVREMLAGISNPVITVLGVAYKCDIDDCRETPATKFIKLALNEGYMVKIYDPYAAKYEFPTTSLADATDGSDCIVLITDHAVFKEINPADLNMRTKNLFDSRNALEHGSWYDAGFNVQILGNGSCIIK